MRKASGDVLSLPHGNKTAIYFTLHFTDIVNSSKLYYIFELAYPNGIQHGFGLAPVSLQTLPGPLAVPFVTFTSFLTHSLDLEKKRNCMAACQKECLLFINYEQRAYFCNWQFLS